MTICVGYHAKDKRTWVIKNGESGSWGMEIARCLTAPLCFLMSARQSRRATKVQLDGRIDRRARGRRFMMVKAAFLRLHNRNG